MALLPDKEKARYFLATSHLFEHVCDTEGCGKLIKYAEPHIALKWQKRDDGLQLLLGRLVVKVRCMECEYRLHPPIEREVKVKGAGRNVQKVSSEVAANLAIDPTVRRAIMKLLKDSPNGLEMGLLIPKLMKSKVIRTLKKKTVLATIRSMRKMKMFKKKGNLFIVPVAKKKTKTKKIKVK